MNYEVSDTVYYNENGDIIFNRDTVENQSTSGSYVSKTGDEMTGPLKLYELQPTAISFSDGTQQTTALTNTLKTIYDNYDGRITTNSNDIALLNTSVYNLQTTSDLTLLNQEVDNLQNLLTSYKNTQTNIFLPSNTFYQ